MPSISAFKDAAGQIDWPRYHAAARAERDQETREGKWCSLCGAYIMWPKGGPVKCYECKAAEKPAELSHPKYVRCPKCTKTFDPGDCDYTSLYREGDHPVACPDCSHQFEISTHVRHTFTSPPLIVSE